MMSTLVSAGMGVVTLTSTCAALGTAPVRVVIWKLLVELDALVDRACCCGAGIALTSHEVPVCGVLGFGGMKTWDVGSGSRVRSTCSGFADVACAGVVGVSSRANHASRSWTC